MEPVFLNDLSWEMAEVYGAVTDQIMINLARYFPYYNNVDELPRSAFTYQAAMLAKMGQVNRETIRIIRNNLQDADNALKGVLEAAVMESVRKAEPELYKAVKAGIFAAPQVPVVSPQKMRAFQLYYKQSADKLNLVNTVMLESTGSAYRQAVSDVVAGIELSDRISRTQLALDIGAGEAISGVSSWNQAVKHSIDRLKDGGITGFIDHGGHRWSAEAYVSMDIRTTAANTARAAMWETNENFGNDLYLVSSHSGARPLCYPWQNKVISSMDNARDVVDADGNVIHVYAQSETTYGEPAGLFGINCGHMGTPFIPGVSRANGEPQDEEANKKTYAESQEQRRLERKLREEKRDLAIAKAQGASNEEIKRLRDKTRATSADIDAFCEQTGRARHRDREAVYTTREFPEQKKYDVAKFESEQKEKIEKFYQTGGTQTGFNFGTLVPNVPIVPNPTPEPEPTQQNALQNEANELQSSGEEFTPATTRAEAEQYASEHFANHVNYGGNLSLDSANSINKQLTELNEKYPINKLDTLQNNGRLRTANARANGGLLEVQGGAFTAKTGVYSVEKFHESAKNTVEFIDKTFPNGVPASMKQTYKECLEKLKYSRWSVSSQYGTLEATIPHEYGHILADQYLGMINKTHYCKNAYTQEALEKVELVRQTFKTAKANGDIYLVSQYASTNADEFFAECFSAKWVGESLPDYIENMLERVLK